MAWTVEVSAKAARQLERLGKVEARRIRDFLAGRMAAQNPRSTGKALQGAEFGEFWRYRVGDYRIICRLEDHRLVVLVVAVAHRRDAYR